MARLRMICWELPRVVSSANRMAQHSPSVFLAGLHKTGWALVCLGLLAGGACSNNDSTPTDPNTATVAGVDADSDGVRDDIEAYIDQTYSDAPTRNALRQFAKAAQSTMVDAGNAGLSATRAAERFRAIECLMAQRPNDFPSVFTDLRGRLLNTMLRTNAYLQADGQVAATPPALLPADQWASACATS